MLWIQCFSSVSVKTCHKRDSHKYIYDCFLFCLSFYLLTSQNLHLHAFIILSLCCWRCSYIFVLPLCSIVFLHSIFLCSVSLSSNPKYYHRGGDLLFCLGTGLVSVCSVASISTLSALCLHPLKHRLASHPFIRVVAEPTAHKWRT